MLKEVYNLIKDKRRIKMVQEASLDPNSRSGFKTENGLLFGSQEWFNAIEKNVIPRHFVKGIISRVYMSGHNDYPEFEIESEEGKTTWTRAGIDSAYKSGKNVELVYINQKYKRPTEITGIAAKCVIKISIDE